VIEQYYFFREKQPYSTFPVGKAVLCLIKEVLINASAIVSNPRKALTERVEKRFNQRFLNVSLAVYHAPRGPCEYRT